MSKWLLPVLVGVTLSFQVSASFFGEEIVSTMADQKEVAVTIYNENLELVRDQRQVDLPEGTVALGLREVSARIRPETALLSGLRRLGGLTILEQIESDRQELVGDLARPRDDTASPRASDEGVAARIDQPGTLDTAFAAMLAGSLRDLARQVPEAGAFLLFRVR